MTLAGAQKQRPLKSQKGFGHFELFWVLLAIISTTFGIRFGGWILGVDIGWAVCIFLGLISLVALVVVIGVIDSKRARESTGQCHCQTRFGG